MTIKHPFIEIQFASEQGFLNHPPPATHMLVGLHSGSVPTGAPLIKIERVNPQHSFATFEELEDFVLDHFDRNSPKAVTENISGGGLAFVITRAAHKIAMRTRRGPGNRVLVHPEDLKRFTDCCVTDHGNMFIPVAAGAVMGRLTHVGLLNNSLDVWTHPSVPRGAYVVLYNSRLDGAAAAIQTHTGWHLSMMPSGFMADAKDYALLVS